MVAVWKGNRWKLSAGMKDTLVRYLEMTFKVNVKEQHIYIKKIVKKEHENNLDRENDKIS